MLIIFDLDDTLIDTSGTLTPFQLKKAFYWLIENGVDFPKPDFALELLLRLNKAASSAKHAIEEFFEINQINFSLFDRVCALVYEDFCEELEVQSHDMAIEVLHALRETHKLALVTVGKPEIQFFKMKKAGIHSDVFSKIIVTATKDKKNHYKSLIEEFDMDPADGIVCGDRIAIDLTPAKELGLTTVQMLSGRGVCCVGNKRDVDFSISHLGEIYKILPQVSNITSFNR